MQAIGLRRAPVLFGLLLIATSTLAACGDDAADPTTIATTTTVAPATTITAAATTTLAAEDGKTPAATVEELIESLYTALNARDDTAFRALSTDTAYHDFFYYYGTGTGMFPGGFDHSESDLSATNLVEIEVLGDPLIVGDAVAIPVRYTHANEVDVGFDLLVVQNTPDGYLIAGGATFYAREGLELYLDTGVTIWEEHLRWNDDDTAGVLALMDPGATLWDQVTDPGTRHTGDELSSFITASLWFQVELPGDPMFVAAGPFAAAPTRLVAAADSSDGITLYLVRDGKIILQAFAQ